jgi:3-deoxy-D-arabino-heptulosonate 7-phosphate (DAHP) synthase class II
VGIKISNKINDAEFLELNRKLNPQNEQGKLIIIIRMGHKAL